MIDIQKILNVPLTIEEFNNIMNDPTFDMIVKQQKIVTINNEKRIIITKLCKG